MAHSSTQTVERGIDIANFLGLTLIWGSSYLWTAIALEGMSPTLIVFLRMAIASTFLFLVARYKGWALPKGTSTWVNLTISVTLLLVIPQSLYAWGLERIDSNLVGLLAVPIPLFTVAFGFIFGVERHFGIRFAIGLVLGLLGVVLIVAPWNASGSSDLSGEIACLLAVVSSALALVYMKKFVKDDLTATSRSLGQLIAGAVVSGIPLLFVGTGNVDLTFPVVSTVLFLGIVGSAVAAILNWRLLDHIGAARASMVSYLTPVVAVILGVAVRGEELYWHSIVGGVLVLVGLGISKDILAVWRARNTQKAIPEKEVAVV